MTQDISNPHKKNSFFLLGPRGTGKTYLVKTLFESKSTFIIDLLNLDWEEKLSLRPQFLYEYILSLPKDITHVVIDEIQKIPRLLNVIHALIENTKIQFILTGSSTKKLRASGVNLLAGRAFVYHLFPLTFLEVGQDFKIEDALNYGTLLKIYHLDPNEKISYLRSYAALYLKEEIWNEHLVRKLNPFRKFLEVAALSNAKIISMSNIAKDVGVDDKTVTSYYQILEDTLLGFFLEPFQHSFRKRLSQKPKFYLFDTGVCRTLARQIDEPITPRTSYYGEVFEHFIICEIHKLCTYFKPDYKLSYIRTQHDVEIDLVIERPRLPLLLIEIKSSNQIDDERINKFQRLATDLKQPFEAWFLCQEEHTRICGNVTIYPWDTGIKKLFNID